MPTEKIILLHSDTASPPVLYTKFIGYNGVGVLYPGQTSGPITSTVSLFPTETLTCKTFDLYVIVSSVSGTFSPGQGLVVQIPMGVLSNPNAPGVPPTQYFSITPPMTTPFYLKIHFGEDRITGQINNQTFELDGLYPWRLSAVQIEGILRLQVSGTSPSFGVDAWILCEGEG